MGLLVKKKVKKKKTKRMRSALHKRERGFFTIRSLARAPRVATFYYSTLLHYDSTKMNAQINGHFLILPIIIHRNQQNKSPLSLFACLKQPKSLYEQSNQKTLSKLRKFQILCRDLKVPFWQPFKSAQTVFIELLQKG